MTTPEDDPRLLQSWEDAFSYPIPIVRGMERRLRANVEEGRERLRGVVGYDVAFAHRARVITDSTPAQTEAVIEIFWARRRQLSISMHRWERLSACSRKQEERPLREL